MKKNNIFEKLNIFGFMLVLFAGLLTFSCENGLTSSGNKKTTLRLNASAARTIITEEVLIDDLSKLHDFTLEYWIYNSPLGPSRTSVTWETYEEMKNAEIDIAIGYWSFLLTAKTENGILFGDAQYSNKIIEIQAGTNYLSFNLGIYNFKRDSVGGIDFTLYFPSEVKAYDFLLKEAQNYQNPYESDCAEYLEFGDGTEEYEGKKYIHYKQNDLPSKNYKLTIKLYADEEKTTQLCGYSEAVSIADNTIARAVRETSIAELYKIEYEFDGGEIAPGTTLPDCYTRFSSDSISLPNPQKEGYYFYGWYLTPDFSGDRIYRISKSWCKDVTLYAKWERISVRVPVYFYLQDLDDETKYTEKLQYYAYGYVGDELTEITPPEGFSRKDDEKFYFKQDNDGKFEIYFDRNEYSLTFDFNDGTAPVVVTAKYGTPDIIPEHSYEGHSLNYWALKETPTTPIYSYNKDYPKTMPAANKTFIASWYINSYKVTYSYVNKEDKTVFSYDYVQYDSPITCLPEILIREGYTFIGWDQEIPEKMPAQDISVNAVYKKNSYTITFNTEGGTEIAPITLEYDEELPEIELPVKQGYILESFKGYCIGSDGYYSYYYSSFPTKMPAKDIRFIAEWKAGSSDYKVNYYLQDIDGVDYTLKESETFSGTTDSTPYIGTYSRTYTGFSREEREVTDTIKADGSTEVNVYYTRLSYKLKVRKTNAEFPTEYTFKYDEPIVIELPVLTGYVLDGWDVELPETMPAKDMEIKANWKPGKSTYIVQYSLQKLGGGFDYIEESYEAVTESSVTVNAKEFSGFSLISDDSITSSVGPNVPIFQFRYSRNTYTITYKINDDDYVKYYSYGATISIDTPTLAGYTFDGWDSELPETMPANNISINPTWKANEDTTYFLRYMVESLEYDEVFNEEFALQEKHHGTTDTYTTVTPNLQREGYYLYECTQQKINGNGQTFVTAKYARNNYTLSFDTDGGNEIASMQIKYGKKLNYETSDRDNYIGSPTKDGSTFIRWEPAPETMPASNITLTAKWSLDPVNYTVRFHKEGADEGVYDTWDQTRSAEPGTMTDVNPTDYPYYNTRAVIQKEVQADGSTVVDVYFDKIKYTITLDTDGGDPVDPIVAGYESNITWPTPTKYGYDFVTWRYRNGDFGWIEVNPETTPVNKFSYNKTLIAQWKAKTVAYTVNHYQQDLEDEEKYNLAFTETKYGTFGNETYQYNSISSYGDVVSYGEVLIDSEEDGAIAQNIYYDRRTVTVSFYTGLTSGMSELYVVLTGKNGAPLQMPDDPVKPGYRFIKWKYCALDGEFPSSNSSFKAEWEIQNVIYKVEHYQQGITDSPYPLYETEEKTALPGSTTEAEAKTYEGFSTHSEFRQAVVKADGSTVIKIYYYRDYRTLTFWDDDESKLGTVKYYYGDENLSVEYSTRRTKTGYTREKGDWTPDIPATYPDEDMTFYPKWTPRNDTSYTVIPYYENPDTEGVWGKGFEISAQGTTDALSEYVAEDEPGYTPEPVEQQIITANGATEVSVYYKLNTYSINYVTNCDTEIASVSRKYIQLIPAVQEPQKTGYTFKEWSPAIPERMPVGGITVTAVWEANTDTEYTVEHYRQNAENNEYTKVSEDTTTETGTTDTDSSATANTYTGFTAQPITQKNINPDGSTVVQIYYTRDQYTITFDTDGGSEISSITKKHGAAITAPAVPTKDGYIFLGWDSAFPSTMPMGNITMTANWRRATVSIVTINQNDVTVSADGTQLTAKAGYITYKWYVNGKLIQKSASNVFNLTNTVIGSYKVMVVAVDRDNKPHSTTIQVNIQ